MCSEIEYQKREREIFEADLRRVEKGSWREKRAAQEQWIEHLTKDPELVAERVSWLLAGHYGKGAYDAAWERVRSPYVKPTFWLLETIGVLEWSVPPSYQSAVKITSEKFATVLNAVECAVEQAKREE